MRYICPLLFVLAALGCQSPANNAADGPGRSGGPSTSTNTAATTDRPGDAGGNTKVAAMIDGATVSYGQIQPLMLEAAGGEVLAEIVLERKIEAALRAAGMTLGAGDLEAEKRRLLRRLSDDPDRAVKLLTELRQRRGLGERRFAMLLRRNAGLRKLVADEVQVTEAMVREAYLISYGPRYRARMILCPNLTEANRARRRVQGGEDFTTVAIEMSSDRSKNQGGLLPDISPSDTTFPAAIRQSVARLQEGQVSDPVALDSGFAILRLDSVIPGDDSNWNAVRDDFREAVRLQAEAAAMQRRVRAMLESAQITVLDSELGDSWRRQRERVLDTE